MDENQLKEFQEGLNNTLTEGIKTLEETTSKNLDEKIAEMKKELREQMLENLTERMDSNIKKQVTNLTKDLNRDLKIKVADMWKLSIISGIESSGQTLSKEESDEKERIKTKYANVVNKDGSPLLAGISTSGGFTIPTEIADVIERISLSVGFAFAKCENWNLSGLNMEIPTSSQAYLGFFKNNNLPAAISSAVISKVSLKPEVWQLPFAIDRSLLLTSSIDFFSWLMMLAIEARANMMDYQVLRGGDKVQINSLDPNAGTIQTGPFTGILNNPSINEVVLGPGQTTYASAKIFEDLTKMISSVKESVLSKEFCFVMHRSVLQALKTQKDTAGNYIWTQYNQPLTVETLTETPRPAAYLHGYPVFTSDWMPSTADATAAQANQRFILAGSFKAIAISKNGEMETERVTSGVWGGQEISLNDQIGLLFKQRGLASQVTLPLAITALKTSNI